MSELIKRIAFLKGLVDDPGKKKQEKTAEEELAEAIRLREEGRQAMTAFLLANLAPIMFAGLVVFLLLGFPVAFSLAACGLFFGWIGVELGVPGMESLLQALPLRIFGIMQNDTLLAIPFFTFMGLILERSGMAEDLLDTIGQLFGPIRGGLAYAVILVGAMLAATTGVVAASVISMGLISLPIMLRYGYDRRIASGVIAASGTLAQIIPPSLVLIILADQLGKSVGDLYKGAFIPGFMLTALYVLVRRCSSRSGGRLMRRRCRPRRARSAKTTARRACARWACCSSCRWPRPWSAPRRGRPRRADRRDDRGVDVRRRRPGLRAGGDQQGCSSWACCRAWPSASPSC